LKKLLGFLHHSGLNVALSVILSLSMIIVLLPNETLAQGFRSGLSNSTMTQGSSSDNTTTSSAKTSKNADNSTNSSLAPDGNAE